MTNADKPAFADALTALGAVMGAPVNDAIRGAYWQFLHDMEIGDFLRAVGHAGRTLKFFPKPAELRELAGDGVKARAAEAWEAVVGAMRKHDYTTSVDFGPLTNAVVANLGGWLWLCNRSEKDLTFDRKRFEEVYALFAGKDPTKLVGAGPCRGAFGGTPVRIAIGGKAPPARQIESAERNGVNSIVRRLADKKSASTKGGAK